MRTDHAGIACGPRPAGMRRRLESSSGVEITYRVYKPRRPREFLKCGLLEHGFARLWCSECRRSVLVAFSCRGRLAGREELGVNVMGQEMEKLSS